MYGLDSLVLPLLEDIFYHWESREDVRPAGVEGQVRNDFCCLCPSKSVIHRLIEMVRNLRCLAVGDQRADRHQASVTGCEVRAKPQITEQNVRGVLHDAGSDGAELLLNAGGPLCLGFFVEGRRSGEAAGS